jgi:hypothetical protein
MKAVYRFTVILFLTHLSLSAQETPPKSITLEDNRHFEINVHKHDSNKIAMVLSLDIFAVYTRNGEKESIQVKLGDKESDNTFNLNYPLNYKEFSGYMNGNDSLPGFRKDSMYMSSQNLLFIFYWLGNLKANLGEAPLAGVLHLRPIVKVYKKEKQKHTEPSYRLEDWLSIIDAKKLQVKSIDDKIKAKKGSAGDTSATRLKTLEETRGVFDNFLTSLKKIKNGEIKEKDATKTYVESLVQQNEKVRMALMDSVTSGKTGFLDVIKVRNEELAVLADLKKDATKQDALLERNILAYTEKLNDVDKMIAELRGYVPSLTALKALKAEYQNEIGKLKANISDSGYHHVTDLTFQFERGFIERVHIVVSNNFSQPIIFESSYALGFTSPFNYRNLTETKLYRRAKTGTKEAREYIYLGDILLLYGNELDNYTRDYSPADTTVKHIDPSVSPLVKIFRSKRVDLMDAKIYSDLLGLAEKNPNGLIQIELCRRVNLFTHRHQSKWQTNYGFLHAIDFEGSITKLEEKERYLRLRNENVFVNSQLVSPSYASTIDFIRYQNFTLGANLNFFLFDAPEGKFTLTVDGGVRYGRVPVVDSSRTFTGNTYSAIVNNDVPAAAMITWYPRIKFEIFAERRYGFHLAWNYNFTNFYTSNEYKPIMSYAKSNLTDRLIEPSAGITNMIEFYARFEPSPSDASSKIFFRSRFHFQKGDPNTFFSQMQVGYSHSIIYKK